MSSSSHIILCALMLMPLVSDVMGQRGPYIKKPVAPVPVVPEVEPEVQGGNGEVAGNIRVKATEDEATLRRIEDLENALTTMKRQHIQTEQAMNHLRTATVNLQRSMSAMATKITELDKLANQNKELTRLLTYFETFFGVLYSEAPEAFDSTLPVETRMSSMNAYLGNHEAELVGLRPKPTVVVEPQPTGVSDEVADAVIQLSQENAKLASKITTLEANVATTTYEVEQAKSKSAFGPGFGSCTCGENIESRLEVMESTLDLLVSSNSASGSSPTSKKAGTTVGTISEDDLNFWRSSLQESRSVTSSRKSVFSAIRHTHLIGNDKRQALSFDTIHVNKGRNFMNNTVFSPTVEGFYFFHFTVRSYDGHYMGVSLVKDNQSMTSVFTDRSERSILQSQSIILHLRAGEMVWLELGPSERFAVHSDVNKYITFNGFLVYKGR